MGGQPSQQPPYNVPIEGTKQKGFSHIYRNPVCVNQLLHTPDPKYYSMKDVVYDSFKTHSNRDCIGQIKLREVQQDGATVEERDLIKFTYGQVFQMAQCFGSYIVNNKMEFNQPLHGMKFIGIFCKNRYEWIVADIASILYGLTIIPLYDTLGIENLTYCLEHSGITTLIVSAGTVKTLLSLKGLGNLVNIITVDDLPQDVTAQLQKLKLRVQKFDNILKYNQIFRHQNLTVTGKNCLTFSYTSGTTGPPKGAMLSHSNFLAFLASCGAHQLGKFTPEDSYVSFLPLPHVFERVVVAALLSKGSFIAFYNGDVMKFKDDLAFVKPTIFVAVPRLYNRIVEGVEKQFNEATGIKGCLIKSGLSSKLDNLRDDGTYTSGFYDSVVFSKVREKFGGRVRLMVTGSAPIKKQVFQMMKVIMCCPFYEGYGQTENTAAAFITDSVDKNSGHVGGVASSLQFKLNDIEEMQYSSDDRDEQGRPTPRGQIWLRGPSVFMGYYKDNEKTKEALTPDGWLRTGDVGMLLPGTNAMKIIDRRKNIFKLQQGQYVAAEKVQNIYTRSHLLTQVFLHGQSHQNFAVAIASVNKDQLLKLAQKNNIVGSYEDICRDKRLREILIKEMDSVGKQGGLNSFQQAKNVVIEPDTFQARGILSSTLKLQRFAAKKYYEREIAMMYQEGPLISR